MTFTRPSLADLIARVSADLSSRLRIGPLLPRSVLAVLARVIAGAAHLQLGYIEWAVKQIFPATAEAEFLERRAEEFGVFRKPAVFAAFPVTFTGTDGSDIPAGTQVVRADGARFSTLALATIASGTATTTVAALVAGAVGNSPDTTPLTIVSSVAGVQSSCVVDGVASVVGADTESDDELRARLLLRMRDPPMGGSAADYVIWALQVPGVTRAWSMPLYMGPGTVGVTVAADDDPTGPIPTQALIDEVAAHIEALRPPTAELWAFVPLAQAIDFQIDDLSPDTPAVRQAIADAIADLLLREGGPGVTLALSHIREAISNAAGESDHVLVVPSANVTVGGGSIPILGTLTWL